jgi:hypothetical protein
MPPQHSAVSMPFDIDLEVLRTGGIADPAMGEWWDSTLRGGVLAPFAFRVGAEGMCSLEQFGVCPGSNEHHHAGWAAVIELVSQQEVAADVAFAMAFPRAAQGVVPPFRPQGGFVDDEP